ncbi:MAG: hypothetical protein KKI08_25705 [Armatimonadetes bacterium]|nr:hypothetical protein [Armatimonadota bacterium]
MDNSLVVVNGLDATTGGYLYSPLTDRQIAGWLQNQVAGRRSVVAGPSHLECLQARSHSLEDSYGLRACIDPKDLAATGWGVIMAAGDAREAEIIEALAPLLSLRREQATRQREGRYQEYVGEQRGYHPGELALEFIGRRGGSMGGPVDPDKMPYYLLVVGDPETIPYRFQYELDLQFSVGRIHFETVEEYACYARSVVQAEQTPLALPRRLRLFGTRNPDDAATTLSADHLVKPLAHALTEACPAWDVQTVLADEATKARLTRLLGGDDTPAVLFTASHGVGFPQGHELQLQHQGALVCQEWPGPKNAHGPVSPDWYFSADDVTDSAGLLGLIAFHFACFGAGTPCLNDFPYYDKNWGPIAPHAFLARLPQRLLAHPQGGALAVVGHVDRAWGYSFSWYADGRNSEQTEAFESMFTDLLGGHTIGHTVEYFNDRYAALSAMLTGQLQAARYGRVYDEQEERDLAGLWTASNDSRAYVVLGDPAVRLVVAPDGTEPGARPTLNRNQSWRRADTNEPGLGCSRQLPPSHGEPAAEGQDFGIMQDAVQSLRDSLRHLAVSMGDALKKAASDASTFEVKTYVAADMADVKVEGEGFTGAELRAVTRVSLDGDTLLCVPRSQAARDDGLWEAHVTTVGQAQAYRGEVIQAATAAATNLLKLLAPG